MAWTSLHNLLTARGDGLMREKELREHIRRECTKIS